MEIDSEKSSRKQMKKGGFYPLICSLDLQYLNITIRFYWKEKEKGFVREWLKSWGKLESDDANHSLLVGKTWIGKISHKRYFQQLQPRTNLILPRKIFKFQLLCRLEIKAQELDDYRGEEFEIFQTNWRRKIGYVCFLRTMFYETKIVVFCSTHALCLFSQLYSPFTVWTWGPQGHSAVMFRCLKSPDAHLSQRKFAKQMHYRGSFV